MCYTNKIVFYYCIVTGTEASRQAAIGPHV